MRKAIVVTRHPAVLQWLERYGHHFFGEPLRLEADGSCFRTESGWEIPVASNATPSMVRDRVIIGNVPMFLAAEASGVLAIEFIGMPPRGQEYSLEDMIAARATLVPYRVKRLLHQPPALYGSSDAGSGDGRSQGGSGDGTQNG